MDISNFIICELKKFAYTKKQINENGIVNEMMRDSGGNLLPIQILSKHRPGVLLSWIYNIISRAYDNKYNAHISECKTIFIINQLNGKICEISTKKLKKVSFKYFSAFRNKEDAINAIKLANKVKKLIDDAE